YPPRPQRMRCWLRVEALAGATARPDWYAARMPGRVGAICTAPSAGVPIVWLNEVEAPADVGLPRGSLPGPVPTLPKYSRMPKWAPQRDEMPRQAYRQR